MHCYRTVFNAALPLLLKVSVLLFAIAFAVLQQQSVAAQETEGVQWEPEIVLYDEDGVALESAIAADPFGQVHVVWYGNPSRSSLTTNDQTSVDAIYYARWDGTDWSSPLDVVTSSNGQEARRPRLAVDGQGVGHLVWQSSCLEYSQAMLTGTPQRWKGPACIAGNGFGSDIQVSRDDVVHVVHAENSTNVVYLRSLTNGITWEAPILIGSSDSDLYYTDPRLHISSDGTLYVVWAKYPRNDSLAQGILYSRSSDQGLTWSPTVELAGVANTQPNVLATDDGVVHVAWNGVISVSKRFHTWSVDQGTTWVPTATVIDMQGGILGAPGLAVDSAGDVHVAGATDKGGYYVRWDGDRYSLQVPIVIGPEGPGQVTDPGVAITSGNQIHVVFSDRDRRIIYRRGVLPSPEVPPAPTPDIATMPVLAEPSPVADRKVPGSAQESSANSGSVSLTHDPLPNTANGQATQPPPVSTSSAIVFGVVPAALLVLGVVVMSQLRRRRQ